VTVGVLTLELRLDASHSLKDKRHVVKSLKDRLRHKFNVAVSEVGYQDLWQRALISAVTVSSDRGYAEQLLQSVEREAALVRGAQLAGRARRQGARGARLRRGARSRAARSRSRTCTATAPGTF